MINIFLLQSTEAAFPAAEHEQVHHDLGFWGEKESTIIGVE